MKKIVLSLALFAGVATTTQAVMIVDPEPGSVAADLVKSQTQTWPGMVEGTMRWYKMDQKAGLWWSTDGKKWTAVETQSWAGKDGRWLKVKGGQLVGSTDGKEWSEVPEWKWEGCDGKWYRFDPNWSLWVKQ